MPLSHGIKIKFRYEDVGEKTYTLLTDDCTREDLEACVYDMRECDSLYLFAHVPNILQKILQVFHRNREDISSIELIEI